MFGPPTVDSLVKSLQPDMIDKNKPMLAIWVSRTVQGFGLGLSLVSMTGCHPSLPDNATQQRAELRSDVTQPIPSANPGSSPQGSRLVRLAKPGLVEPGLEDRSAEAVFAQCRHQLFHGPAVESKMEMVLFGRNGTPALELAGRFQSLGQGQGLAKVGFPMPPGNQWSWTISRGTTCIQTIPDTEQLNRTVFLQPHWLNPPQQSVQIQENCYGSPISLLHWARGHFQWEADPASKDQRLFLTGRLRRNIAQGWGDGSPLPEAPDDNGLDNVLMDPDWLAAHVPYPLPHQIQLTFSDQPNTARTLLEMRLSRYSSTAESTPTDLLQVRWTHWRLANDLTPQDFPLSPTPEQTAAGPDRSSDGSR